MRAEPIRPSLARLAAERDGLIPTFRLLEVGYGRALIAGLVRRGDLTRVRQGWYTTSGLPSDAIRAARVGGQLTCTAALRLHGVWTAPDARLHVSLPAGAVRPRDPDSHRRRRDPSDSSLIVHWRGRPRIVDHPIASVEGALADLERCGDFESFAVALDSALNQGLLGPDHALARRYSFRGIDGVCESGIETLLWLRLPRLRRSIRRQVHVSGVGRVDFLIGDRLIVEVDGREHHAGPEAFERDRRRDALLAQRGYRVLRFSYRQVMHEWPFVESTIRAVMALGEHRARRGSPLSRAE